jgi:hypothetical protein
MASKRHEQLNELANLERLRLVRSWCLGLGLVACLIATETIAGWGIGNPKNWASAYEAFAAAAELRWSLSRSSELPLHYSQSASSCASSSPDGRLIHHSQIRRMAQSRTGWIKAKNYPAECVATLLLSHRSSCRLETKDSGSL